jgi:hypothetical protein
VGASVGALHARPSRAGAVVKFFLGTHHPHWLGQLDVPLFVSRRALQRVKKLPRARASWALDSGGFSELTIAGEWLLSSKDYVALVRRYHDEIGRLEFAAPQDWMCEPDMLARTGLTVAEHQRRTTANYLELRALAPELPFIPVLQGWTPGEYFDHWEAYERAGVDLRAQPLVGVGTVCRRQNTLRASMLLADLAEEGLHLHGFGLKRTGLDSIGGRMLASSDSLAWSFHARREPPMDGCTHASCSNCSRFALAWRSETLAQLEPPPVIEEAQLSMGFL